MSQFQKALARIKSIPSDYTYNELKYLLKKFGFAETNKGNTSGSRVRFYRQTDNAVIDLHKPHPDDIVPRYAIRNVIDSLEGFGDL